jgi:hypothetical protein
MNKKHRNPGQAKLAEIISKVLITLAETPREPTGEAWMTSKQLQETTTLSPIEINDAVKVLEEQGYVESLETYGTAPFEFNRVSINATGRLELERRMSQKIPKSTQLKEDNKEWDLFICHASEDKEEIVRPLVKALIKEGFQVWYDEFTLTLGDSLRRSIDKGLAQSKYGIVILSPNFFKKNWPQTELDGLAARERDGKKVILPIWHNIDREYVIKFSPTLADRVAVSTSKGIETIVKEILKVVKPSKPQSDQSVRGRLKNTLDSWGSRDKESIEEIVKETNFEKVKQMFNDVLTGIALFDSSEIGSYKGIFDFIELAILEQNEKESTELFENFLDWFFQTVTPYSKFRILEIFVELTKLPFLRKVLLKTGRVSAFVAEFGISNSYHSAGVNAQIVYNLQSLLSEKDLDRIVDYLLTNDQIRDSYIARNYLEKILTSVEARFGKAKMEELHKRLILEE